MKYEYDLRKTQVGFGSISTLTIDSLSLSLSLSLNTKHSILYSNILSLLLTY